jgi:hypothetical protein
MPTSAVCTLRDAGGTAILENVLIHEFNGMMMRKHLWMGFVLGLLAVVILSLVPEAAFPKLMLPDFLGHIFAYAVLALIGGIACRTLQSFVVLAGALVFLGAVLELVQALLPTRDASGSELFANFAGVALGSTVAILTNLFVAKYWRRQT